MKQPHLNAILNELVSLDGPVITPEDEGYRAEIPCFNTAIEHTPCVVVGAASTQDIVRTVQIARQYRYPVSVQTTGHNSLKPMSSGILITTRRLGQVSIDAKTAIATIGGGAIWSSVISEAAKHGLAPIAGASTTLGVVGYLLGGGLGPLARSHGFSSDYLIGLTLVQCVVSSFK